ncbi:unnamed protein product [Paramecium pentaurelia]|uniref:Transmembrane protein n=1 Tax=Paramecium pentaurelia TaxID=43138 RepID=A0A8S1TYQ0_9CILI|nr:unnamed protein product [Paramecium pentaurelia]
MQIIKSKAVQQLVHRSQYNKIVWQSSNPYNKRWQYKFKNAYYTYPRDINQEHTYVKTPKDNWESVPLGWAWIQDLLHRHVPNFSCLIERRHRLFDKFNVYFLPAFSLFFYQFYPLAFGFKVLTVLPLAMLYVRARDKCGDPDFKETYLRDMLYKNNEINALFKDETLHVLDYDCEYDRGYPCPEKFPEFKNKFWQFFNTDTSMTTGYFKMADVETGAVMNLKFKTMPVPGKYRYQIGEPFYFYDLRAEITHNGQHKEVVLVDEKVALQKIRPFLLII